jgi:hypothetical protein
MVTFQVGWQTAMVCQSAFNMHSESVAYIMARSDIVASFLCCAQRILRKAPTGHTCADHYCFLSVSFTSTLQSMAEVALFCPLRWSSSKTHCWQVLASMQRMLSRHGWPPSHIFLVGGLGSSDYLLGCIKTQYEQAVRNIVRPANAFAAVLKGADCG